MLTRDFHLGTDRSISSHSSRLCIIWENSASDTEY